MLLDPLRPGISMGGANMDKRKIQSEDEIIDEELIAKGRDAIKDFDQSQEILVAPKKKVSKLISIRIPVSMMKDLKAAALKTGVVGYQKIIKDYIAKGLLNEKRGKSQAQDTNDSVIGFPTTSESLPKEKCEIEWEMNLVEESNAAAYK